MMEQGTEEEVFEVYKILARRKTRKGNLEYLVRWKNYGEEDDTWEPIENLQDCDEVLNDFNERLSKGDALHFEQSPKKHRRFQRVTDSPSRDSNASSRGSTPPRTRAILNGPELHRHDQQSRDEGGSLKLASNPEDVSSMMKKRSPNYLKPKTGPKWEFLSISPSYLWMAIMLRNGTTKIPTLNNSFPGTTKGRRRSKIFSCQRVQTERLKTLMVPSPTAITVIFTFQLKG
ncbi:putative chromodomain Y-like protein [Apostichopus japonicus]|uniref:Putative chromodomain Y-like protein n=1 Tax=Stichopus japonicus TaxID=307972 RepID=A0A2G8K8B0_STIJA|nr:putative chromodomain Y-like protein [Apostichopus japonicus]